MGNWIEFPGLGIRIENINPSIEIFGIQIYWYGIIISVGFLLGIILGLRACRNLGFSQDDIITYILAATPAALVGARLYYVIFTWNEFQYDFWKIINTRDGGLAIYGGIIGAVIAVAIMARIKKHNILRLLDFAMPYIALGQAIGRWGNFVNQEAYGRETNLPWRMTGSNISGAVHPNFLYESLICFSIFAFLLYYRKKLRKYHGQVLFLYMITYGIGRSVIEYIRGDDALVIGNTNIRVSLVLSLILVVAGILAMIFIKKIPGTHMDMEALAAEIRAAYIKDTGKDPDTGLPVETDSDHGKDGDTEASGEDIPEEDDEYTVFGSGYKTESSDDYNENEDEDESLEPSNDDNNSQ